MGKDRNLTSLLQQLKDGEHFEQQIGSSLDSLKETNAWMELEEIKLDALDISQSQEATNVMVLMDLLHCAKAHPKISCLLEDQVLLNRFMMAALEGMPRDFYDMIYSILLFVVHHGEVDWFVPLIVNNKNKDYLPGIWKHLGAEKFFPLIDKLMVADGNPPIDGFCLQTVFEFLMGILSEVEGEELKGVVERLLFILSLTESKQSLARLSVPKHNLSIWKRSKDWFELRFVKTPEVLENKLLTLCFSLLALDTSKKAHPSQSPYVVEMGKKVYKHSKNHMEYFFSRNSPGIRSLLCARSSSIELLYLLLDVGSIEVHELKSIFFSPFLTLMTMQTQSFTDLLQSGASVLPLPCLPISGPFHFYFRELLSKEEMQPINESEREMKNNLLGVFKDLSKVVWDIVKGSSLEQTPIFFSDVVSWVLSMYKFFVKDSTNSTNQKAMEMLATLIERKWVQMNPGNHPPSVRWVKKESSQQREPLNEGQRFISDAEKARKIEELERKIRELEAQQ